MLQNKMLHSRTAIITGSTSGIGQGIARALAHAGANVVINGFGEREKIQRDCEALAEETQVKVIYDGADLTKSEQIAALVANAKGQLGSVDILVNNAGVQHVAPIDEFPAEKWDLIIGLNLSAAFHTTRLCAPLMREVGWGRIINIASAHALVASPYKSAYVAAKHGIAGLTKVVALELAQENITCNAVCPGYVWTPLVKGQIADTAKARGISEEEVKNDVLLAAQPSKKFVTVEQLGELATFLCSDAAASITGSVMPMDGGWTAK